MKKIFLFATALLMSASMFAEGSVFTYQATEKLTLNFMKLGTIATHEFKDGNGKVTYNETITTIGTYAFNCCSALQSITIPASVTTIGKGAFNKAGLTSITLPAGVTEIGESAFNQCESLASVTLPEGVTTIGEYAFDQCGFTSITIPASVTTIGGYAFYGCALTSITIPAGVTTIGGYTFYDCTALASVTFLGNACQKNIGSNAFGRVGDPTPALLTLPANWTGTKPNEQGKWYGGYFTLAAPAPKVGDQFLDEDSGLKFEVTAVGETNTVKVTKNSYAGTTYTVPAKVSYKSVDFAVTTIGTDAFFDCQSLTSITLPEGLTTLEEMAFQNCQSLQSVTLPEGLTTIGEYDFECCYELQSITIPASVTTIGIGAFGNCTVLASVTFLGNACQDAIGEDAFPGVGEETPALLTLPDNWTGTKPDKDGNWYGGKFKLNDTALPQMRAAVKATKVMTNGQVIFRAENKNFSILGQEVR